jgi:pimeloyl-ACP methyl ester carboxylesterase
VTTENTPYPTTRSARLVRALAIIVLVVLTAVLLGQIASAEDTTSSAGHSPKPEPTIVLVHGAWADASSWHPVTRKLQSEGYQVLAPPNPLRSLSGDAAYLSAFLRDRTSGPVVLVGHSYGGAVITNAGTSDPDVKALVYINGFAPDEGESVLDLVTAKPGSALAGDPATVFDFVSYPGAPAADVDLYVKQDVFPHAFANDLPPKRAAVLAASQRPITFSAVAEPSGPPAWETIPSWYLVGTADNVIPPAQQRAMAQRAGSTTVEVKAGHLSMLSRPNAVTDLIRTAASSGS